MYILFHNEICYVADREYLGGGRYYFSLVSCDSNKIFTAMLFEDEIQYY